MDKTTYKLGIIGGMGPLATNELYNRIILSTPAKCDNEHINTIILSHATLPDRTECILNNTGDAFLNSIKKDFDILNQIKVDKIAIPCNTSHYFYEQFIKMTDIPVINMVEESIKEVKIKGFKRAFVFCTKGTYQSQIYEKYAKANGVEILYINEKERDFIMGLIYNIKNLGPYRSPEFETILKKYLKSDTIGILACTELSLIPLKIDLKEKIIDALNVLLKKCLS